jgi:hypothetical protein
MNPVRIQWMDKPVADFHDLVQNVPIEVLHSPRRSVVPLLEFCRDPATMLAELQRVTGVTLSGETDFMFEHAVPVQKGQGKPSFTDLLILTSGAAIGIEAKYTEPEYESVRTWLRDPVEHNRSLVLDGWLGLLSSAASRPIRVEDVAQVPYQLIHRVSSVCHVGRSVSAVVYIIFGKAATHYVTHMKTVAALLVDKSPVLAVLSCSPVTTARYDELTKSWDAGERKLGDRVRSAMLAAPLMTFNNIAVEYHSRPSS